MTEGKTVTVDVVNQTKEPEMVHWHGFQIPPEVDGAHEEGTPMVQGMDRRRFVFTPRPTGTRWYHTHAIAGHNLRRGTYSGQFGMVVIEPRTNPARYELEVPIVLHEWDGDFSAENAMDVEYNIFSVNGKMLGAGEPIRVQLSAAPGNGAPFGGIKVIAESGWFAARPSGTEEVYKIYAESFRSDNHLRQIQRDAETRYGVPVEAVTVGDTELDDNLRALLAAAREATINAAKWSGADVISLFAEVEPAEISLVVRDRGQGFDPEAVPADRKGLAESVHGRMTRRGGTATVSTAVGEGTKVTLKMPRTATPSPAGRK